MARLTYLTPLMVGVLALAGCPASDDAPQETDSVGEDSTGTTTAPTTMTTTPGDSTSTTDDSADSSSTGMPDVCEPACDPESECCISGICFDQDPPACDPPCGENENCVWPEGANQCPPDITPGVCETIPECDPPAPAGDYDSCYDPVTGMTDDAQCEGDALCLAGDGFSSCGTQNCDPADAACTCPTPPATGDAVVTCGDVTDDGINDCYLSCDNGESCPDGMFCVSAMAGSLCVAPDPLPGYGDCVDNPATTCQPAEDGCMTVDNPKSPNFGAGACTQTGCADASECILGPDTGDSVVACGDLGSGNTCYLDCSGPGGMGDGVCPDGMTCSPMGMGMGGGPAGYACVWTEDGFVLDENFEQLAFRPGWELYDVDGNTPNDAVAYVYDAWIVDAIMMDNAGAISTSWYDPLSVSDDWMVTPLVTLGPGSTLSWEGMAPDASYADDYQVYISAAGNTPADFMAEPGPVFDTMGMGEAQVLTPHTVDLAASGYASQDVYIAFRNNSDDKFLLFIDNVQVTE